MPSSIRQATQKDVPAMVDLLLGDAEQRRASNPALWKVASDARARVEAAIGTGLGNSDATPPALWLLAETAGRIVGITHSMIVQPPPIYEIAAGAPGLLLDDCFTTDAAPPDTAEALLVATEAALRAAGAGGLIASCPAAGPLRPLYERHGYEPVTLYKAKTGFSDHSPSSAVRPARPEDIAGIVARSAEHRKTLSELNSRFWHIHPDADARFEMWMRYSLTLGDRDMLAAGAPGEVDGYAIAQPIAPLLIPAAHDISTIGVIDDFYDRDFADVAATTNGGVAAATLLSASESAFARRGFASVVVVCPAKWASKASLLEREGYRTAKLWMLKR